jgi:hypothetical protein
MLHHNNKELGGTVPSEPSLEGVIEASIFKRAIPLPLGDALKAGGICGDDSLRFCFREGPSGSISRIEWTRHCKY